MFNVLKRMSFAFKATVFNRIRVTLPSVSRTSVSRIMYPCVREKIVNGQQEREKEEKKMLSSHFILECHMTALSSKKVR